MSLLALVTATYVVRRQRKKKAVPSLTLVGCGGWAAVIAGALFLALGYIHTEHTPPYFAAVVNIIAFLVPLLFWVGLVGVYESCRGRVGHLGRVGFALGLIGAAWGIVNRLVDLHPWYLYFLGKRWLPPLVGWLPLLLVGLVVAGVVISRTKALQGWNTLPLMLGVFGWVYYITDKPSGIVELRPIHIAFGVLFGISWMLLGYILLRKEDRARPRTMRVC